MQKYFSQIVLLATVNVLAFVLLLGQSGALLHPAGAVTDACDNPYMPLRAGDVIEYKTLGAGQTMTYVMRVNEVQAGVAKIEYEIRTPNKMVVRQNIFCKNGALTTDSYMDFFSGSNNFQMKALTKDVSGELIPKDLKVGSVWNNKFTISYQYGGVELPKELAGYEMVISSTNKVVAEEKVTVPAGTFTALKIETTHATDMSLPDLNQLIPESARSQINSQDLVKIMGQKSINSVTLTQNQWWVKNIGLVKVASTGSDSDWQYVATKIGLSNGILDNPTLEAAAEKAVAPAAATAALVNTAIATQPLVSVDFLRYIIFFLTQPIFFFRRKKQTAWGTVYNSLSRLPEDLAIVKLYDAKTKKLISTQVTDDNGRFVFLVPVGQYQLEVTKKNFVFPSALLKGVKADDKYTDLYFGTNLEINSADSILTPNIPIDPQIEDLADLKIKKKSDWQKKQKIIALISPALGFVSFIIKPSLVVTLLFILSILTYFFFRRFAIKKIPKKWGKVSEDKTMALLPGAVMRVFALPFNRLFDYKVTDKQGRYNFLVGNRQFLLTVSKDGYQMHKSAPLDFSKARDSNIIAEDISLKK